MRITVSHTKSKEEPIRSVDRSLNDLFRGTGIIPVQFVEERRIWHGIDTDFLTRREEGCREDTNQGHHRSHR